MDDPMPICRRSAWGQSRRSNRAPVTSGPYSDKRTNSSRKKRASGIRTPAPPPIGVSRIAMPSPKAARRGLISPPGLGRSDTVVLWADTDRLWPCVRCHDPGSLDCTTWIGLTISGTKQPSIGNLPSRLTIPSSKTRCLSWRPCVKRSPIISRTISQAGNWSLHFARRA